MSSSSRAVWRLEWRRRSRVQGRHPRAGIQAGAEVLGQTAKWAGNSPLPGLGCTCCNRSMAGSLGNGLAVEVLGMGNCDGGACPQDCDIA